MSSSSSSSSHNEKRKIDIAKLIRVVRRVDITFDHVIEAHEAIAGENFKYQERYPLYVWTIGEGESEQIIYLGKRASGKTNRFTNGHAAAIALLHPNFAHLRKRIYFGKILGVYVLTKDSAEPEYELLSPYFKEWDQLKEKIEFDDIVDFTETILISDWCKLPPHGADVNPVRPLLNTRKRTPQPNTFMVKAYFLGEGHPLHGRFQYCVTGYTEQEVVVEGQTKMKRVPRRAGDSGTSVVLSGGGEETEEGEEETPADLEAFAQLHLKPMDPKH